MTTILLKSKKEKKEKTGKEKESHWGNARMNIDTKQTEGNIPGRGTTIDAGSALHRVFPSIAKAGTWSWCC